MHRPYALLAARKTVLLGLVYGHSNCLSNTSNFNHFSICSVSCKYAQVSWQVLRKNIWALWVHTALLYYILAIIPAGLGRCKHMVKMQQSLGSHCTALLSWICSSTQVWYKASLKSRANQKIKWFFKIFRITNKVKVLKKK